MKLNKLSTINCGVVGAGLAGSVTALELADNGVTVDLFTKDRLKQECNSYLIAGGLSAVEKNNGSFGKDSYSLYKKDILKAGKGLNDRKIVDLCSKEFYSEVIEYLINKGIQFDKKNDHFDLNEEGGHSKKRIFHASDTTGMQIMDTLWNHLRHHDNIKIHEYHYVIDLITKNKITKEERSDECLGFYVYDIKNNAVKTIQSKATFIATGGLGKVFLYTSNTDSSSADGFAMCYRSGLPLVNMEFIQFHPTVFYDSSAITEHERRFLLTEALRGEGAILKLYPDSNKDFVLDYDPNGSRATRDIVVLAEDIEMRKHGLEHVWLDCTTIPKQKIQSFFKNSYNFCLKKGIDITKESVPVIYAVHYSNGGVLVDTNSSTEMKRCYVIGETAYTGLHGATRLASNSGSECVLFARRAAQHFLSSYNHKILDIPIPLWNIGDAIESKDKITVSYYWEMIRRTMHSLCGMSRNEKRLIAADEVLLSLKKIINEYYWNYKISKDFLEVRNIADVANIIIESALAREESRGCHFREDFPDINDKDYLRNTVIKKGEKLELL